MVNLILNSDSYKASHFLQYPPDVTHISSYIEARGGVYSHALFFGLQMYLKEYLMHPIKQSDIDEAAVFFKGHGEPFNRAGWEYILEKHGGYLPLVIEAVPEGSIVPIQNVLVQLVNTDPKCYWLTSYIETSLLRAIWYPTTVATLSLNCKIIIKRYLEQTADNISSLPHRLHDFGARGGSSLETVSLGGAAHLVNFMSTDTIAAVLAVRKYYNDDMAAFSFPAAEHSTITCWGRDHEVDSYRHILETFGGKGNKISIVSDSYDFWNSIDNIWGKELKEQVINNGGIVIIRPDSGEPIEIVTSTIEKLMEHFGCYINSKGYRVLPDYLRVIQSNGIGTASIEGILAAMKARGQSAENITFGMGGELLQRIHRDTMKFAMKASAVERKDHWYDVYKAPLTDQSKFSKKGRLALIRDQERGGYRTIPLGELQMHKNELVPIFFNGKILQDWVFEDIRQRAHNELHNFI